MKNPDKFDKAPNAAKVCGKSVYWWDGEYEGECELPEGHEGDHYDGLSWFNDGGGYAGPSDSRPSESPDRPTVTRPSSDSSAAQGFLFGLQEGGV